MIYRCRMVQPSVEEWGEVEADSPPLAANEYHLNLNHAGFDLRRVFPDGRIERVHLALIEVEGHGPFISRLFSTGIFRKGGVHPTETELAAVANKLGWTGPPKELLEDGWDGEETYDDAKKRQGG
jgi:hypothetical protein